jgi:hypothetical protein
LMPFCCATLMDAASGFECYGPLTTPE